MSPPKPTVLLLTDSADDCADVSRPLAAAGYALRTAAQSAADTSFAKVDVVAVAVAVGREEFAVAATRRVRAATADSPVPVLWLLNEGTVDLAAAGLVAGADVCLVRPVGAELLAAQTDALRRTREQTARFAARGADAGDLAQRLQKLFRQSDADADFARRVNDAFAPAEALTHGPLTAAVARRAPTLGASVCDVAPTPDGRLRVVVVDVAGVGQGGGAVLAEAVARGLMRDALTQPPGAALTAANRRLLALPLPDGAMVAAAVAEFTPDGCVTVACGGLPAPIRLTPSNPAEVWTGSGPFLGVTATTFPDLTGTLASGERLLLLGGGGTDRRPDVREAADRLKEKPPGDSAKAVADEVFADETDGFALLVVARE